MTQCQAPTLGAIKAVVVDHVAFNRGGLVMAEDLVFGSTASVVDEVAEEALALVAALAREVGRYGYAAVRDDGALGPRKEVSQTRFWGAAREGRELEDYAAARERLYAACWRCGCCDDRACEDGCGWVSANLCSGCVGT